MQEKSFSQADLNKAEALIRGGKVSHLLFSEGTYQVEVQNPPSKTPVWPFLQLDDSGKILDCFCTCPAAEKKKSCPHLAAALLTIFNKKSEPLHVRFRDSFWNQLCQIASHRHGYDTHLLKTKEEGIYQANSATGKRLFFIRGLKAKGKERLSDLLLHRKAETEETSLKFSNLPAEEIALWKEGRPSHQLRYELSFWSDLAKWWMLLQDAQEEYSVAFKQEKDQAIPNWVIVRFPQIEFGIYIAEVNWPQLIPSLATIRSPLSVYEFAHERIQKITYDYKEEALYIDFEGPPFPAQKETPTEDPPISHEVGEWVYVPKLGFYPSRIDPLLKENRIPKTKISALLQKHQKIVQKYLFGTKIHRTSVKAQYHLCFDATASLCLNCYVFEPGDLQEAHCATFGPWAYLHEKGFYLLENLQFEGTQRVIPKAKVSDFVNRHRAWLHAYEGFQTHLSIVETPLAFLVTKERFLRFEPRLDFHEEAEEVLDFGEWLYIKGRGFYAKMPPRMGFFLRTGMTIPPGEVSKFIRTYKEELEQIQGFFSSKCPLEKTGLSLSLNEEGRIVVHPEFFFLAEYDPSQISFFGDYTYVKGEGFCPVPPQFSLPEMYSKEKVIDPLAEPYFIAYELDLLQPFLLSIDPGLRKPKELRLCINQIKKDEKAKTGEWILDLHYETEWGKVEVGEIWKALNDNKRYFFSKAGLIIVKQPRFNWLKGISKKRWLGHGRKIRLTTLEWIRLSVLEQIQEPTASSKEATHTRSLLEEFKSFQVAKPLELAGLKSDLRAYQETGVRWLWFLYCHGLSGLLCDEMGLGKTHQAMGLIAAIYNASSSDSLQESKYLVVCPTSVIYHWEELLKRFFPTLKVHVFYGAQRRLENRAFDLLLTSYGVLRSEKKALAKLSFSLAVFDEIQIAKNAHSQTHKALRSIDAQMRLGLTGTPIENRLLELKALFDLVLPTYFPTESLFKDMFVNPIEKSQDPEKKALLARLIKPFILRRKKSEVLLELPEKTEEIAYCDLSEEQRELYQKTFLSHRDTLLHELGKQDVPVPFMHVFALFSTLKQICDHPCVINKEVSQYHQYHSGKWDLFVQLLEEARDSGQKLVVFSQYLTMLDIIETYLKEKSIGFAGIRGSTRDRKSQLEKFRTDPACEVFVASLQAVGVGVDLVAASVVIHYDRWWNPAKENQATDRVHRMGQSRGVQVFKMVTKGTIEEHIHHLIEKKMQLVEGVIGFDEQDQIKGLDRKELLELLSLLNQDLEKES